MPSPNMTPRWLLLPLEEARRPLVDGIVPFAEVEGRMENDVTEMGRALEVVPWFEGLVEVVNVLDVV